MTVRIVVFGAESTGKTTLAEALARRLHAPWVPEFARAYLEDAGRAPVPSDLPVIARGQRAAREAALVENPPFLVEDTDELLTSVWSEFLFGSVDDGLAALCTGPFADLHVLTSVDIPFVPDPVRYIPEQRERFHARCLAVLTERGVRVVEARGSVEERVRAVDTALTLLRRRP